MLDRAGPPVCTLAYDSKVRSAGTGSTRGLWQQFVCRMALDKDSSQILAAIPIALDAASRAEEMARGVRVELVFGERILAAKQLEFRLVDPDHQRVFALADRAVARGEFRETGSNSEADRAAVAGAFVASRRSDCHSVFPRGAEIDSISVGRRAPILRRFFEMPAQHAAIGHDDMVRNCVFCVCGELDVGQAQGPRFGK